MLTSVSPRMSDVFDSQEARSSGELWTEICSTLPGQQPEAAPEDVRNNNIEFNDSFQPAAPVPGQLNGHTHGTGIGSSGAIWEPMEDSEIYIASLGNVLLPCVTLNGFISSIHPIIPSLIQPSSLHHFIIQDGR